MKYLRKFDSVSDMNTTIASSEIDIIGLAYNGSTPVMRIKTGGTPVPPTPSPSTPFYIEDVSGSDNTVQITKNASAPTLTIEKSTDGESWESMGNTATVPANGKLYLRCSATSWSNSTYRNSIITTGNSNVGGNVMSLLYGNNFTGNETTFPTSSTNTFYGLFLSYAKLINASQLILPATTLVQGCYNDMFNGCTSLTTAPALPATTLAQQCYQEMFKGCTALTTAPELPATTLAKACYSEMFNGCTSLTYIKCLATDISASNCTLSWLSNVAATGTFVKDPSMSSWTTDNNGIPSGWTVQDATA